jgi:DNA-binding response OmpR family regulator
VASFYPVNAVVDREMTGVVTPEASPPSQTILVVDDDENDVALLKLMFGRSRILNPVQTADSLKQALAYLSGEGAYSDRKTYPFPTIMLVDIHLRDGSGFDLLRWFQVHSAETPVAVVMLTGSDVRSFKMSYELGAHSFLTKPLKFEDFHNMVRHVRGIKLTQTEDGHLLELD